MKRGKGRRKKPTESIESLLDVFGKVSSGSKLVLELNGFSSSGDFAGKEVPEHGLWEHFGSVGGGREHLLHLRDGPSPETDTLLSIKHGRFPDHGLDSTHTTCSFEKGIKQKIGVKDRSGERR